MKIKDVTNRMLIIPVFVPHAGCPHKCCFCNQKLISGQMQIPTNEEICSTVEQYRSVAGNYAQVQLAFYGGSFTGIPEVEQERYLRCVQKYMEEGFIDTIRISTRPDCINEETLARLTKYGVTVIELGVQSMDDNVLSKSNRGHKIEDTIKAAKLIKQKGFTLGIQTMPGLPGSNTVSDYETACQVVALKPAIVRIYPTIIIKDTELEDMYKNGMYKPMQLSETVELCAGLFLYYQQNDIEVIRMGLQSSDNISEGGSIVAGPYHPAFGQLVKSRILLGNMVTAIEHNKLSGDGFTISCEETSDNKKFLTIKVNENELSDYVGQKRCNIIELMDKFYFDDVRIITY